MTEAADEDFWVRLRAVLTSRQAVLWRRPTSAMPRAGTRLTVDNLDAVRAGLAPARPADRLARSRPPTSGPSSPALPEDGSVEFVWEAQDGTIRHAIVDDTEYQELAALVAGARAACALPLYADESHPLFRAVLPDGDGVVRARW
ncbi:hypothetical protein LT493_12190 [Streptomyces tricolor]|nr:hypothetical protein [Streptomyces tricolor]